MKLKRGNSLIAVILSAVIIGCASPMGFKLFGPGSEYECSIKESKSEKKTDAKASVKKGLPQKGVEDSQVEYSTAP